MKQILVTPETKQMVDLNSISSRSIIGMAYQDDRKAFATQTNYGSGEFKWLSNHHVNLGNSAHFTSNRDESIQNWIKRCHTAYPHAKYFVFETEKELFAWLAE